MSTDPLRVAARKSFMLAQAAARGAVVRHWLGPEAKPSRATSRELGRRFDLDIWPPGADASVAMQHVQHFRNVCRRVRYSPGIVGGEDVFLRQTFEWLDELPHQQRRTP